MQTVHSPTDLSSERLQVRRVRNLRLRELSDFYEQEKQFPRPQIRQQFFSMPCIHVEAVRLNFRGGELLPKLCAYFDSRYFVKVRPKT